MAAPDPRWSGRSCGPDCAPRRSGPLPVRGGIASWTVDPAPGCGVTRLAADQDRHRIAEAFVAAALRLGPAAVQSWKSCREHP